MEEGPLSWNTTPLRRWTPSVRTQLYHGKDRSLEGAKWITVRCKVGKVFISFAAPTIKCLRELLIMLIDLYRERDTCMCVDPRISKMIHVCRWHRWGADHNLRSGANGPGDAVRQNDPKMFGSFWMNLSWEVPMMSKDVQSHPMTFLQSFQSPEVDLWYLWSRLISRKITSAACQTRVLRSPRRRFQLCLHCPRRGPVHQEQEKPHRTGLKSPYSAWFLQ